MRKTAQWKLPLEPGLDICFFRGHPSSHRIRGASVRWLGSAEVKPSPAGIQLPNFVGRWAAATLPQCRLGGSCSFTFTAYRQW
jgi:hypothetical protein